ncbi:GNAT family N-acetyltransferase [Alienimonas californiensis]|uniref:N-acetyltransferase domain-containing protein n=1 Tax=Alienimonas californiensis TaxID=2527989 RepID=A0A517P7G2_9PLAN|nr:GNAT family N-acetyltransferase [Alienimonas californiensis]QDT15285.1 hypothetical protein CA12_13680 [Alienimonas californiensis]
MPAPLETARLHLLPFEPDDAPRLIALDADPEVVKYVFVGPFQPPPPERYEAEMLPRFLAHADDPALGFWRVHPKDDRGAPGPFAGWVLFRPVGEASWFERAAELNLDPAMPELGYRFARAHWGRGFATEAAQAVSAGRGPVAAIRQAANVGSGRVLEKCGLPFVRTFQLAGVPGESALHRRTA